MKISASCSLQIPTRNFLLDCCSYARKSPTNRLKVYEQAFSDPSTLWSIKIASSGLSRLIGGGWCTAYVSCTQLCKSDGNLVLSVGIFHMNSTLVISLHACPSLKNISLITTSLGPRSS